MSLQMSFCFDKRLQYFHGTYTAYKNVYDEKDLRLRRLIEKKSEAEKTREMAEKQANSLEVKKRAERA